MFNKGTLSIGGVIGLIDTARIDLVAPGDHSQLLLVRLKAELESLVIGGVNFDFVGGVGDDRVVKNVIPEFLIRIQNDCYFQ